jgi:hypothetical protein
MRRVLVLLLMVWVSAVAAAQAPDRDGLLAAWEASVRDDPATLRFDPLGDGRYRYVTERFPFDGTLEVTEVVIDDRGADGPFGVVTGHVAVQLEGVDDDFRRRHATSLGVWQSGHTMMWDPDGEGWIPASEWSARVQERYGGWWTGWLPNLLWLAVPAAVLLILWLLSRRANRQMHDAMAQQQQAIEQQERAMQMHAEGLELAREANRLLARIVDVLESGNR